MPLDATSSPGPTAAAKALAFERFPVRSLGVFALGAVILRLGCVVAWGLFPGTDLFQQLARVLIPLAMAGGLIALSEWLLRRDGFGRDALRLNVRHFHWFGAGCVLIAPVILAMAGLLAVLIPLNWERGLLSWGRLVWQAAEYFAGNLTEELIFRGYLLLVLTRHLGLQRALLIVAVLFGLFHLPGLSTVAALKMICTTALGSYMFAYGFVLTGSLWAAVGMHAFGNLLLHQILGISGAVAVLRPVLVEPWPTAYDPAFLVWLGVCGLTVLVLVCLSKKRTRLAPAGSARSDSSADV